MAQKLSEGARKARNLYARQWYAKNKARKQQCVNAYWERKAVEWGLVDELDE